MFGGGVIDWASFLIKVLCHSSQQSEIGAANGACKALKYLRQLATDLGLPLQCPVILFIDNEASIDHSGKMGTAKRTAHFERWEFNFRQMTLRQWIKPLYLSTKKQPADAMSKVVDMTTFFDFRKLTLSVIFRFDESLGVGQK